MLETPNTSHCNEKSDANKVHNFMSFIFCHIPRYGNIKMDLTKIKCESVEWIQLAQDWIYFGPLVDTEINFRFCKM